MSSKWDSVKKVIATVAPGLATGIGGPLAGAAVAFITQALGIKDEDQAIAALQGSPDAILKLREAEIAYQQFLAQAGIDLEKIAAEDRGSARTFATARGMWPQVILSVVYTVGYFGMVFGIMTATLTIPSGNGEQTLFSGIVAIMTGAQLQILNFWFGSSSGSARKTELAAQAAA